MVTGIVVGVAVGVTLSIMGALGQFFLEFYRFSIGDRSRFVSKKTGLPDQKFYENFQKQTLKQKIRYVLLRSPRF